MQKYAPPNLSNSCIRRFLGSDGGDFSGRELLLPTRCHFIVNSYDFLLNSIFAQGKEL